MNSLPVVCTADSLRDERRSQLFRSSSTLKKARLPGMEKFKFSTREVEVDGMSSPAFIRGQSTRSSCPPCMGSKMFNRMDSKRKPILPISCRKTCRVLSNTALELNVDSLDVRVDEQLPKERAIRKTDLLQNGTDKILANRPVFANLRLRRPSTPGSVVDSGSTSSSSRSSQVSECSVDVGQPISSQIPNWMNLRSPSRLSSSSHSSSNSEEDIWIPRKRSL